jgi:hypothetical protein
MFTSAGNFTDTRAERERPMRKTGIAAGGPCHADEAEPYAAGQSRRLVSPRYPFASLGLGWATAAAGTPACKPICAIAGSNRMFFTGGFQARLGSIVGGEPWGHSMDDATVFVHELGHTLAGFNVADPWNTAFAENTFRSWAGTPTMNDYGLVAQGRPSLPVPSRGFWANLLHPWY